MEEKMELMKVDNIHNRVYMIRGQQVMLDVDLAEIYGYDVKRLNEQVKRNITRFPEDFMFQLNREEMEFVKSQFATSRNMNMFQGQDGGRRKLPYAFTEQGIYMLTTVLRGELAEQQSIFIMRTFREMRHYIKQNQQFVTQSEMHLIETKVSEMSAQLFCVSDRQKKTEKDVEDIRKNIEKINENFVSDKDLKNFVIYQDQKFEADAAYIEIYQKATTSIYIEDDYVNTKSLQLLSQKKPGVDVILFTENGHGRNGFLTTAVVDDFANQYPSLCVKENLACHDRWIVLDYGLETEEIYHCGVSSKDAGKKLCAINKMEDKALVHPLIDKLLLGADKKI